MTINQKHLFDKINAYIKIQAQENSEMYKELADKYSKKVKYTQTIMKFRVNSNLKPPYLFFYEKSFPSRENSNAALPL